jgi:hypothetical protein
VTEGKVTERHQFAGKNGQPLQLPSLVVEFVGSDSSMT